MNDLAMWLLLLYAMLREFLRSVAGQYWSLCMPCAAVLVCWIVGWYAFAPVVRRVSHE